MTQPRGHPHSFVPCFGAVPSLVWGLDDPKNQRCGRERAGSQTGAGSAGAPHGPGFAAGGKTELPVRGVLVTKSLIIFSVRVVANSVRILGFSHWGSIRRELCGDHLPGPGVGLDLRAGARGRSGNLLNSHICFPGPGS